MAEIDWADVENQLKQAGGGLYDPTDLEGIKRNTSYTGTDAAGNSLGSTLDQALANQRSIYQKRSASTSDRKYDSQSAMGNLLYGSGSGNRTNTPGGPMSGSGASAFPSPSSQFSDPLSKFLEQWSNTYAKQLENPSPDSGQGMLEDALKKISAQFAGGGYTPAEQEVFQTQALDPIERLRTARKQQVMEELSRRGIDPKSGVALSMLQDVDRQFDSTRAQTQRSIAGQGAQETQQRMLQAVQLLASLAGTQGNRMGQAFNYYSVPYNLSNNAFGQAMQFYGQNNPLSLVQPLLALSQQQQGQSANSNAALADLIWALTHAG